VQRADGAKQRVPLRPAERLLSLHELESGWIGAGIRVLEQGAELLLVEQTGAGLRRLGLPAAVTPAPLLRTAPVVLAAAGVVEGLAWLEGTPGEPLSVASARRVPGGGWEETSLVSRPGRGSQSGLVGMVLPDGRWLLIWSRFDGTDDELVWSLGDAAGWSAPRTVHADNDTPDVTPALFARSDLQLLAWGRMVDDEYRVLTARWNGAGWEAAREAAGAGTLYPTFADLDGDPYLVARQARTGGWELVDLDRSGMPLRRARLSDAGGRPALFDSSGTQARLLVPGSTAPHSITWETVDR
jgi:hypothetical protein